PPAGGTQQPIVNAPNGPAAAVPQAQSIDPNAVSSPPPAADPNALAATPVAITGTTTTSSEPDPSSIAATNTGVPFPADPVSPPANDPPPSVPVNTNPIPPSGDASETLPPMV